MKKMILATAFAFILWGMVDEASAAPRLLNVRQSSSPEYTRIVLDLDGPPNYEIQPAANSSILVVQFQSLTLPQGSKEIPIEDRVIRKVKLESGERARVILFLYQPARWNVFTLKPNSQRPDRLVIDVFKGGAQPSEKVETPPVQDSKTPQRAAATIPEPVRRAADPPRVSPEPPRGVEGLSSVLQGIKDQKSEPEKIKDQEKAEEPVPKPEEFPKKAETARKPPEPVPQTQEPPRVLKEERPAEKEAPPKEPAPVKVAGMSKLLEIRQWSAPDHTRIVIDLDGPPAYEVAAQTDPLICTMNFRNTVLAKGAQEMQIEDQVIRKIKVEPTGRGEARLTLFLIKPGGINTFLLKPYLDKPDRLVIDVSRPDLEEKEKMERQVTRELKARKKMIIVLDAGHGGEDPGAIGPRGTLEKNIVLSVALSLQKVLDASGEVRAFLTRRGDYFVPLNDRLRIAQEYGADLFISIHANGSKSRQTRGTSIYCLSTKGASDTASQLLAQKENASDLVGGISRAPHKRDLDTILLDLEQTHSINESLQLGGLALSELARVNHVQFNRPLQAGFAVLKAPQFPAILVETAYITHPVEESMLGKKSFQENLCQAISSAIKRFLPRLAAREANPAGREEAKPRSKGGA